MACDGGEERKKYESNADVDAGLLWFRVAARRKKKLKTVLVMMFLA